MKLIGNLTEINLQCRGGYGTLKKPVLELLSQGKDVLFDIDWQGTQQLKKNVEQKKNTVDVAIDKDVKLRYNNYYVIF